MGRVFTPNTMGCVRRWLALYRTDRTRCDLSEAVLSLTLLNLIEQSISSTQWLRAVSRVTRVQVQTRYVNLLAIVYPLGLLPEL